MEARVGATERVREEPATREQLAELCRVVKAAAGGRHSLNGASVFVYPSGNVQLQRNYGRHVIFGEYECGYSRESGSYRTDAWLLHEWGIVIGGLLVSTGFVEENYRERTEERAPQELKTMPEAGFVERVTAELMAKCNVPEQVSKLDSEAGATGALGLRERMLASLSKVLKSALRG